MQKSDVYLHLSKEQCPVIITSPGKLEPVAMDKRKKNQVGAPDWFILRKLDKMNMS
jgi:hypothetical protein